jgi:hypothetical protein
MHKAFHGTGTNSTRPCIHPRQRSIQNRQNPQSPSKIMTGLSGGWATFGGLALAPGKVWESGLDMQPHYGQFSLQRQCRPLRKPQSNCRRSFGGAMVSTVNEPGCDRTSLSEGGRVFNHRNDSPHYSWGKSVRHTCKLSLLATFVYIGSFFVLMDPNERALDGKTLSVRFQSAFRFSEGKETLIGARHLYYREVTLWNYFYWPVDFGFHAFRKRSEI